jgi:hypothetical protein
MMNKKNILLMLTVFLSSLSHAAEEEKTSEMPVGAPEDSRKHSRVDLDAYIIEYRTRRLFYVNIYKAIHDTAKERGGTYGDLHKNRAFSTDILRDKTFFRTCDKSYSSYRGTNRK